MAIADKLLRAKEDLDGVYTAATEAFWDNLQNNGKRTDYRYAFYYGAYTHIDPKWKVAASNADNLFAACGALESVNWSKFDLSRVSSLYSAFGLCDKLEEVDTELNVVDGTPTLLNSIFRKCYALKRVKKLTAYPSAVWKQSFEGCSALEHILFDGTIGSSGLDLKECTRLDGQSIYSVIQALSDTAVGQSVTLSKAAVDTAFGTEDYDGSDGMEWDLLTQEKSNWTIILR